MDLTPEQLQNIALLGANFRPVESITRLLCIEPSEALMLLRDKESAIYKAYWPALEIQAAKLNQAIIEAALRDSSPAQQQAVKLLDKCMKKF